MAILINNHIIDRSASLRTYLNQLQHTAIKHLSERDARIVTNHAYAMHIAAQYQHLGVSMEDLFATAMLGLTEASDHFDPEKGSDFTPYACCWIRSAINKLINDCGRAVRIPDYVARAIKLIGRTQENFFVCNGYEATASELSEILDMDEDFIKTVMLSTQRFQSLDTTMGEDADYTKADTIPGDMVAPDVNLHSEDDRKKVEAILHLLRPNQREVLVRYFFNEESFSTIAMHMGITPTRVRQIYHQVCPIGLS